MCAAYPELHIIVEKSSKGTAKIVVIRIFLYKKRPLLRERFLSAKKSVIYLITIDDSEKIIYGSYFYALR